MYSAQEIKYQRMNAWIDQVLKNLQQIEEAIDDIGTKDFKLARQDVIEQYRLIRLMKNVLDGRTKLDGWIKTNDK